MIHANHGQVKAERKKKRNYAIGTLMPAAIVVGCMAAGLAAVGAEHDAKVKEPAQSSTAASVEAKFDKARRPFMVSIGTIEEGTGFKITAPCEVLSEITVLGEKEVELKSDKDDGHSSAQPESQHLRLQSPSFRDKGRMCIGSCAAGFQPEFIPTNQEGHLKQAVTCLRVQAH